MLFSFALSIGMCPPGIGTATNDSRTQDIGVPEMCGLVCIMLTQAGYSGFAVASYSASNQPAMRNRCTLKLCLCC